jgi:hypothetical protein
MYTRALAKLDNTFKINIRHFCIAFKSGADTIHSSDTHLCGYIASQNSIEYKDSICHTVETVQGTMSVRAFFWKPQKLSYGKDFLLYLLNWNLQGTEQNHCY